MSNGRSWAPAALLLTLALTPFATATPALASTTNPTSTVYMTLARADVEALLTEMKISFEPVPASDGTIRFKFNLDSYTVLLLMGDCTAGECKSLQLYTNFTPRKKASVKTINEWNKAKRYSRAYIDPDGNAALESDLDMEYGVTMDAVREFVRVFRTSVAAYALHVGYV
jgi:hypothetical protein